MTIQQLKEAPYGTVVRHGNIRYFKSRGVEGDVVTSGSKHIGSWSFIHDLPSHGWHSCTFLM